MEYRNVRKPGGLDPIGILDSAGSSCIKPKLICQYLARPGLSRLFNSQA